MHRTSRRSVREKTHSHAPHHTLRQSDCHLWAAKRHTSSPAAELTTPADVLISLDRTCIPCPRLRRHTSRRDHTPPHTKSLRPMYLAPMRTCIPQTASAHTSRRDHTPPHTQLPKARPHPASARLSSRSYTATHSITESARPVLPGVLTLSPHHRPHSTLCRHSP